MGFEEKFAETQAKMTEWKNKITEAMDAKKSESEETTLDKVNAFVSDPDGLSKVFGKFDEALAVKIVEGMDATEEAVNGGLAEKADEAINGGLAGKADEAIKAGSEAYEKAATKVMDAVDDGVESADSSFYAAQEAARLAVDQGQSKIYSGLLQAQMRIEAAKAKIAANKEAAEQADKEELVDDMLKYAESCQKLAYKYVKEAEDTMQEARDMIYNYKEEEYKGEDNE